MARGRLLCTMEAISDMFFCNYGIKARITKIETISDNGDIVLELEGDDVSEDNRLTYHRDVVETKDYDKPYVSTTRGVLQPRPNGSSIDDLINRVKNI